MFQFFQTLLGYNFHRIGCNKRLQQKYELGTRLTYFWHKNEKKIFLNFIFLFQSLRFQHTYPSFLLSKLVSQIKLIQSVVGSVASPRVPGSHYQGTRCQGTMSQDHKSQDPGYQFQSPKVLSLSVPGYRVPESQVSGSQVSGSQGLRFQVSVSRVLSPRFQVLILDYAIKIFIKTSVIRQKEESQNRCFQKAKHVKFSAKRTFLTPWYAHIRADICYGWIFKGVRSEFVNYNK